MVHLNLSVVCIFKVERVYYPNQMCRLLEIDCYVDPDPDALRGVALLSLCPLGPRSPISRPMAAINVDCRILE